ncbi:VWA domain-containing protein [Methylotuvimicrobium sp. KM2]|uniref:vWA domain-containing protein n=1 Tax=Methylotuvimicrobium sp. KM2 TaxID=3133976 RepID=UPI003100E3C6
MAEEILINYSLNKDMLAKHNDQCVLIRLDIEPGPDLQSQADMACDICLVLDASSSMDEPFSDRIPNMTKRQGVMQAAKAILPQLSPQDKVSIIFYDSRAHHIATGLSADQRNRIEQHIDALSLHRGGTNFESALRMVKQILPNWLNNNKRVLFLTDGNANAGNPANVATLIDELTGQGVVLDCLGVGKDFNFTYMRRLSGPSNGFTELLETPEKAQNLFQNLLLNTQRTIAQRVFLNLIFPPEIRDIEVYQQFPEMRYFEPKPGHDQYSRLELNIGTLRRDRRNIYLLKTNLDAPSQGNNRQIVDARLDYDIPALNLAAQRTASTVFVNFTDQAQPPERDTSIDDLYYEAELTKLFGRFVDVKDTDWRQGAALLQEMIQRANALGDTERLTLYQQALAKLQQDKQLSNDDLNRIGQSSSHSTQQLNADLTPPSSQRVVQDY